MDTHKDLIKQLSDQKPVCSSHCVNESDTSSYLPSEIIQEIIVRLPFKSKIRFQVVSKSWNAMISEARFSRVHFHSQTIINSDSQQNLVLWQSYVSALQRRDDDLYMDCNSDFTVDHSEWKAMLPLHEQEVVWKSASLVFSIDRRTGKNCFMVGPTNLEMSSGEDFERKWEIQRHHQSRFSNVAVFVKNSKKLFIRGVLKLEKLSPETIYAAYLVFTAAKNIESTNTLTNDSQFRGESCPDPILVLRSDGRREIEIGEMFVPKGDNRDIEAVVVLQTTLCSMKGLIVEGIEFRPSWNK